MPSNLSYHFFAVFTYKHLLNIKEFEEITTLYFTSLDLSKCIIIKEYGLTGQNPHLNIVFETKYQQRADTLKQTLYKKTYEKAYINYQRTSNDLKIKEATDIPTLICGYLAKEVNCEIIYNKSYNLEEMRTNKVFRPSRVETRRIPVFVSDAQDVILLFSKQNSLCIETRLDFKQVIFRMIANGYDFNKCIGKFYVIFAELQVLMSNNEPYDNILETDFHRYESIKFYKV